MDKYQDLEEVEDCSKAFSLKPKNFSKTKYLLRTDRNIGWLTKREQELLHFSTVGVAGCGGMGGNLAATLLRAGIGCLKIADLELFDSSNLNRQFGATEKAIGKSKVIETARMLREITSDSEIQVFPGGINKENAQEFSKDCTVICDELEFWAIAARIALHQSITKKTVILNANSVGMSTRLFRFTKQSSYSIENILGITYVEAEKLENAIKNKTASSEEIRKVLDAVLKALVPEMPEYMGNTEIFSNIDQIKKRLFQEGKAPILGSNPPMATGFLANHVILEILRRQSPLWRDVVYPPDMPGYLLFDAAKMTAKSYSGIWWLIYLKSLFLGSLNKLIPQSFRNIRFNLISRCTKFNTSVLLQFTYVIGITFRPRLFTYFNIERYRCLSIDHNLCIRIKVIDIYEIILTKDWLKLFNEEFCIRRTHTHRKLVTYVSKDRISNLVRKLSNKLVHNGKGKTILTCL